MDAAAHHRLSEVRRLVVHLVVRLSSWVGAWARGRLVQETVCLSTTLRQLHRSTGSVGGCPLRWLPCRQSVTLEGETETPAASVSSAISRSAVRLLNSARKSAKCLPKLWVALSQASLMADPELGPKPLLAKLREQQPDLGAGNKEVREALTALKAESEATEATAAAPPAAAAPRPPPPRLLLWARAARLCPRRWR